MLAGLGCASSTSTPTSTEISSPTPTPTAAPSGTPDEPFNEADLRALLPNEEIEAAIPFVIGDTQFQDFKAGAVGAEQSLGFEAFMGLIYSPAEGASSFMLTIIEFESLEFVHQHIAMAKTDQDPVSIGRTIGDDTLVIQAPSSPPQNGVAVVLFWKGDKGVSLNAIGLPQTREVLGGVVALAELAESRLISREP